MKLKKVIIAKSADWEVLYIDGIKRLESDYIYPEDVLKELGIECYSGWAEDEWFDDNGNHLDNLNLIK